MTNSIFSLRTSGTKMSLVLLASALTFSGLTAVAQQPTDASGTQTASQTSQTMDNVQAPPAREGFWGRVNPFARKKWVTKRLDPIKGQLNELDEVNAKNSKDIKDVDSRAQAGISKAQSAADAANQAALAAGQQAGQANTVAGQATGKVGQLNTTVNGLDQYSQVKTVTISFRGGVPVLNEAAKKDLDDLATALNGQQGYLLEVTGYNPAHGIAGVQNSGKLNAAVERYLVTAHSIPVYRMHAVALGNATAAAESAEPVKTSHVDIRLMENSLAAKAGSTPQTN